VRVLAVIVALASSRHDHATAAKLHRRLPRPRRRTRPRRHDLPPSCSEDRRFTSRCKRLGPPRTRRLDRLAAGVL